MLKTTKKEKMAMYLHYLKDINDKDVEEINSNDIFTYAMCNEEEIIEAIFIAENIGVKYRCVKIGKPVISTGISLILLICYPKTLKQANLLGYFEAKKWNYEGKINN